MARQQILFKQNGVTRQFVEVDGAHVYNPDDYVLENEVSLERYRPYTEYGRGQRELLREEMRLAEELGLKGWCDHADQ